MNTWTRWTILAFGLLAFGCAKQQYGECAAPDDDLQVLFKPKVGAHPFSHSFCVVCNPSLEPDEYADWAIGMGAAEVDDAPETPCLYAYANREVYPDGFESLAQCQAGICEGTANYNDVVSRRNGNIDLDPVIGPAEE